MPLFFVCRRAREKRGRSKSVAANDKTIKPEIKYNLTPQKPSQGIECGVLSLCLEATTTKTFFFSSDEDESF